MNHVDDPETSDGLVNKVKHEGTLTVGSPTSDDTPSSTTTRKTRWLFGFGWLK
ncbi:hypothetical protein Hdeb2414_s0018g00517671 [Helianthus debilis subsp. tardiflorus]